MRIRRLLPADAGAFQDLRLRGLLESPTAFGSSYEEEVDRSIPAIAASLAEGTGRNMFGALIDNQLVGVVGVGREPALKQLHRGFIRSMYVAPQARGRGIGKALMQEAVHFARAMPGLRQLTLTVTAGNSAALATYKGFGFKVYGTAPAALQVQGIYYDEIQMVYHLEDAIKETPPSA